MYLVFTGHLLSQILQNPLHMPKLQAFSKVLRTSLGHCWGPWKQSRAVVCYGREVKPKINSRQGGLCSLSTTGTLCSAFMSAWGSTTPGSPDKLVVLGAYVACFGLCYQYHSQLLRLCTGWYSTKCVPLSPYKSLEGWCAALRCVSIL